MNLLIVATDAECRTARQAGCPSVVTVAGVDEVRGRDFDAIFATAAARAHDRYAEALGAVAPCALMGGDWHGGQRVI